MRKTRERLLTLTNPAQNRLGIVSTKYCARSVCVCVCTQQSWSTQSWLHRYKIHTHTHTHYNIIHTPIYLSIRWLYHLGFDWQLHVRVLTAHTQCPADKNPHTHPAGRIQQNPTDQSQWEQRKSRATKFSLSFSLSFSLIFFFFTSVSSLLFLKSEISFQSLGRDKQKFGRTQKSKREEPEQDEKVRRQGPSNI